MQNKRYPVPSCFVEGNDLNYVRLRGMLCDPPRVEGQELHCELDVAGCFVPVAAVMPNFGFSPQMLPVNNWLEVNGALTSLIGIRAYEINSIDSKLDSAYQYWRSKVILTGIVVGNPEPCGTNEVEREFCKFLLLQEEHRHPFCPQRGPFSVIVGGGGLTGEVAWPVHWLQEGHRVTIQGEINFANKEITAHKLKLAA